MARSDADKAQIRTASLVIIFAMVAWMGLSLLGGSLGLPVRFAFLIDMLCLAAFAWALFVLFNVWRRGAGKG
ncbi:MAG: DUF5337 family protein [Pseudomonadota bacterium]